MLNSFSVYLCMRRLSRQFRNGKKKEKKRRRGSPRTSKEAFSNDLGLILCIIRNLDYTLRNTRW